MSAALRSAALIWLTSPGRSAVRIDFVAHTQLALVKDVPSSAARRPNNASRLECGHVIVKKNLMPLVRKHPIMDPSMTPYEAVLG